MIKLKRIKLERENEDYNEAKSLDNYELQTFNFVKNTLPLYLDTVNKLKYRKLNTVDKRPIKKLNSVEIFKTRRNEDFISQKNLPKEGANITNIKFENKKIFYEYTSLELDKMREEGKRREIKKIVLPPIIKNNNLKTKNINKEMNNSIMKNRIINFEIVHYK